MANKQLDFAESCELQICKYKYNFRYWAYNHEVVYKLHVMYKIRYETNTIMIKYNYQVSFNIIVRNTN